MPSPSEQLAIDYFNRTLGEGNAVSAGIILDSTGDVDYSEPPTRSGTALSVVPRQGATQEDVWRSAAGAVDTRELEIGQQQGSMDGARDQALAETREVLDAPRDVEGNPRHGQRAQELANYSPAEALFRSLLPQIVEVGGDELTPLQRDSLQTKRNEIVRGSQSAAMRMADAQNIPQAERAAFIQEQSRILMSSSMNDMWSDFYQLARSEVMTENGLPVDSPLPEGEVGTQIRVAATERASRTYDNIVAAAFADDADIRLGGGRVFRSTGPDEVAQPLAATAERIRDGGVVSGADTTSQIFHSIWRGRDALTGEVTESGAGAAIRNLGLFSTVITAPVFQAATWDRDPTTGLPLDPSDVNYRIHQWTSDVMQKLEASDNAIADIAKYAMLLPAAISGAENITENTMSTGNVITDFAISHSQGEWEGTDIASLHALQVLQRTQGGYWNWHDDIFGLAAGVAVPAAGATTVARRGVRMSADALAALSRGANANRVAEGFEALSLLAKSPTEVAEIMSLSRLADDVSEELGGTLTGKTLIGRRLDGAEEVADRFNRTMSDDLSGRLMGVVDGDDLRRVFPSLKPGLLDDIVQETFIEVMKLREVATTGRAGLMQTSQGKRLLNHIDRVGEIPGLSPHPAAQARLIIKSSLEEKLAPFIQKHTPNNWVFVGRSSVIVRKSSWLNNRDEFNSSLSKIIDASLENGNMVYKNGDEVASYLSKGLGGSEYNKGWIDTLADIRAGKGLDVDRYAIVNTMIRGELAREMFKGAAVASGFSAEKARRATAGRSFTRIESAQTMYKGMRAFFGGKSDYSWVAGFKKGDKTQFARPKIDEFMSKSPPVFRKWADQTINRLTEAPRAAEDLIRAAIRAPDRPTREVALQRVFKEMSSGDVGDDYMEILNIFYYSKTNNLSINNLIKPSEKEIWSSILAKGGSAVTERGIRDVIAKFDDVLGADVAKKAQDMSIQQRRWFRLNGKDDLDQLMSGWATHRMKEQIWKKAFVELEELMPNVMARVPDATMIPARKIMLRQQLLANGVPPKVFNAIESNLVAMLKMSDSDRRVLVNGVMKYMFEKGGLATGDDLAVITRSITGSIAEIAKTDDALKGVADKLGSSFLSIRRNLTALAETNPALGNIDDLIVKVYPAVLRAVTDLDMNVIRSRFAAFGVESSAAVRKNASGLRGSPVWQDFGEVGRLIYDPTMEALLTRLQKPGNLSKIQDAFEQLRPMDRANSQWFFDMLQTTKRMTVTGLLGGFPLPGLRFMGNNLLGHWLITAVTAPGYIMTVMKNTPTAAAQSFVRAAKRSGWWVSDDVYDFNHARYVAKPDEVIFETVDGEMWTKKMFDDAMDRNNLRFTQISHEFQSAVFEDWVRASQMGPDGKSIRSGTRVPWNEGPISRGRFWDFLRPDKKNIWSMVGEEADILQREAVFRAALKNGLDEDSASLLARNSMLDYGSMPTDSKALSTAKRYIPFFAFRYNMFRETAEAFVRDGRALQNIARVGKMVNAQRDSMEEWVLEPDYAKNRLFNTVGKDFREWHTINVGVQIPWMEHYASMFNIGETAMRLVVGGGFGREEAVGTASFDGIGRSALTTIRDAFLSDPRLSPLKSWMDIETGTQAPSGYMPAPMLEAFAAGGMLDTAVSFFGLEAVPLSEQRPDLPTFDGEQYRFRNGAASGRWLMFNEALLVSGLERNIRDNVRLLIRMGIVPDGVEARRDGEGHWAMYALGGTTYSFESAQLARINAYEAQMRTLNEIKRQPTTRE